MEPETLLSHSQELANSSYPEPDQSNPWTLFYFLKIRCNITLPSMPRSFIRFLFISSPNQNLLRASPITIRTTCPANLILLDLITRTIMGEQYRSLSSSLFSFVHSAVNSSLLGPNILLNNLFSYTLNLRSSRNASEQVSHSYKTEENKYRTKRYRSLQTLENESDNLVGIV